jgi:hypothetical protein
MLTNCRRVYSYIRSNRAEHVRPSSVLSMAWLLCQAGMNTRCQVGHTGVVPSQVFCLGSYDLHCLYGVWTSVANFSKQSQQLHGTHLSRRRLFKFLQQSQQNEHNHTRRLFQIQNKTKQKSRTDSQMLVPCESKLFNTLYISSRCCACYTEARSASPFHAHCIF